MKRAAAKTPVMVLSGFLGSGKTTLLNALLRHPSFASTAVIVNELGEIGLDNLLIAAVEENVVLLSSGCLCCGLGDSLRETLLDLRARRLAGTTRFDRVVVETTGIADPAPILQSLLRDKLITANFAFETLVTVVDALFAEETLEQHADARQQVALADRLVISKLDLVPVERGHAVAAALRERNPLAVIVPGLGSGTSADEVFGDNIEPHAGLRADIEQVAFAPSQDFGRHRSDVQAHAFIVERSINWSGLAAWIDLVPAFFGGRMLRCKGLVAVTGAVGPVLIQGVQTVFAPPRVLESWPDGDRRSRLVCITRGLEPDLLRASLATLHAAPGTYRPANVDEMLADYDSRSVREVAHHV